MNKEKTGYFLLACAAITADQWLDSIGLLCAVIGFGWQKERENGTDGKKWCLYTNKL